MLTHRETLECDEHLKALINRHDIKHKASLKPAKCSAIKPGHYNFCIRANPNLTNDSQHAFEIAAVNPLIVSGAPITSEDGFIPLRNFDNVQIECIGGKECAIPHVFKFIISQSNLPKKSSSQVVVEPAGDNTATVNDMTEQVEKLTEMAFADEDATIDLMKDATIAASEHLVKKQTSNSEADQTGILGQFDKNEE